MTKFYATQDFDGHHIEENAEIAVFDSRAEAETYITAACHLEDGWTVAIEEGNFSDCWIKSHRKPSVGDHMLKPFTFTDVYVARPGQHPGGNVYWVTPSREILVAVVDAPMDDDSADFEK